MSTYTLSQPEIEHLLRRQAQQIADTAFPQEPSLMRDARAQQWFDKHAPGLLASIGLKGRE